MNYKAEIDRLECELENSVDEVARLSAKLESDRQEWIAHIRTLGLMLRDAKEEGILDTIIEANLWPLPKCAITEADVRESIRVAKELRPQIEKEHERYDKAAATLKLIEELSAAGVKLYGMWTVGPDGNQAFIDLRDSEGGEEGGGNA